MDNQKSGLVLEVVTVATCIDGTATHMKNGEKVEPWSIETIVLRVPLDVGDRGDDGDFGFRVGNLCGAYMIDNTFTIQIVDPELQGKFKVGDRIDLLGGLKGK